MTTAEMKAVITAFEEGKTIEYLSKAMNAEWRATDKPCWDFYRNEYRVKPRPKYKPYDTAMEIERDKWVKTKNGIVIWRIEKICPKNGNVYFGDLWHSLKEMFEDFEQEKKWK